MAKEKTKYVYLGSLPCSVDGKSIQCGEIFETEKSIYTLQGVGSGDLIEVTKENEKELTVKYAKKVLK